MNREILKNLHSKTVSFTSGKQTEEKIQLNLNLNV